LRQLILFVLFLFCSSPISKGATHRVGQQKPILPPELQNCIGSFLSLSDLDSFSEALPECNANKLKSDCINRMTAPFSFENLIAGGLIATPEEVEETRLLIAQVIDLGINIPADFNTGGVSPLFDSREIVFKAFQSVRMPITDNMTPQILFDITEICPSNFFTLMKCLQLGANPNIKEYFRIRTSALTKAYNLKSTALIKLLKAFNAESIAEN